MDISNRENSKKNLGLLWLMMLSGCLLVFHNYILGNETMVFQDIGLDTKQQYLMWYNSIVNHLREGSFSGWDFNNGFGVSVFIMNLAEPFLMLLYFLGVLFGPEHLAGYMVYTQILKILLSGTACYYFLKEYDCTAKARILASFAYAFNGYLMVWGQHYHMSAFIVWLPLLLMYVERTPKNWRSFPGVAFVSAVTVFSGYYQGYMVLMGCGIFICLRVLLYDTRSRKKKWSFFALEAGSMLLGVLMAAVTLLPSISALSSSSRMELESSLLQRIVNNFSFWKRDYYKTIIYRLFGSTLQGSGSYFIGMRNFYEAANLFFSTLFILLLFQYIFTIHRQNTGRLQKTAQYLGVGFAAFTLVIKVGSLPFNGFVYAFTRHTFLLMPFFALLCGKMLDQIMVEKRLSWLGLLAGAASVVLIYGKAYQFMPYIYNRTNALLLCVTGLVMAVLLVLLAKKQEDAERKRFCYFLLALALFVNVMSDTVMCYYNRDTLKKNDANFFQEMYHSSVNRALAWLQAEDNSFYRVEKDFDTSSGCMDSLAQNYMGVSTYNSAQNENIAEFVSRLWPQVLKGYDKNHYLFANSVREQTMASLTGVKYLLSRNGSLMLPGYELFHQIEDIYIYRNTGTDSIGKFFTQTVDAQSYEAVSQDIQLWPLLRTTLITDEKTKWDISKEKLGEYQKTEIENVLDQTKTEEAARQLMEGGLLTQARQTITLPLNASQTAEYETVFTEFVLKTDTGLDLEITMDGKSPFIWHQRAGKKEFCLQIPRGTETIEITIYNEGATVHLNQLKFYGSDRSDDFSGEASVLIDAPQKDNLVTGKIKAGQDGIVMLAIPYQTGWNVYLNGAKQQLMRGDYGFLAFEVEAGEYDLRVEYQVPLLRAGIVISAVCWLVWLFLALCLYFSGLRGEKNRRTAFHVTHSVRAGHE